MERLAMETERILRSGVVRLGGGCEEVGKALLVRSTRQHDWLVVWKDGSEFHAATGPLALGEAPHAFRVWVESEPHLPG